MLRSRIGLFGVGVLALGVGCSRPVVAAPTQGGRAPRPVVAPQNVLQTRMPLPASATPEPASQPIEPWVLLDDPALMGELESRGLGFSARVSFGAIDARDQRTLSEWPGVRAVLAATRADVETVARSDRRAGVGIRGHAHRLFDVRWLSSPEHRFELVAVAQRMDRRPFHESACGEMRLIYRLRYTRDELTSRLPMTAILELRQDAPDAGGDCRDAARHWIAPARDLSPASTAAYLTSVAGPFAPSRLGPERVVQLAINVQTVRWPSTVRPNLGGHAEYVLRAFRFDIDAGRYVPRLLENTPDVSRIATNARTRAALLTLIREPTSLASIDHGTFVLPDTFAAFAVRSVTPRGLQRRANRPYRQLIEPRDLNDIDLSSYATIRSPEALVRRLDQLTCSGCHQSRSIAGFHLLGDDAAGVPVGVALVGGRSPHLVTELDRRARYVRAVLDGAAVDDSMPPAERGLIGEGGYGAACGDGDVGFKAWTCAAGLRCQDVADGVGTCLPERAQVGDSCEPTRVVASRDPRTDHALASDERGCGDHMICESTAVGFPGGMCAARCSSSDAEVGCGSIAVLDAFNACLARSAPFTECLREVRPAGLRRCSDAAPCRDDYVCARAASGIGTCIPPYFLFPLRVDGHR